MRGRHVICWGATLAMLCVFVAGCGKSGRSPLGKVTGTVTYNGEPVEEATIVFHNPKGRPAKGRIVNGEIKDMITYDVLNDGVPLGKMTITLHPAISPPDNTPLTPGQRPTPQLKPPFPPRYGDPDKSGLTAEIVKGANNLLFELTD